MFTKVSWLISIFCGLCFSSINCVSVREFDNYGKLLDGGKIYFYITETSTLAVTYFNPGDNISGSGAKNWIPSPTPTILDVSGQANICGESDLYYTVVVDDKNGVRVSSSDWNKFFDRGTTTIIIRDTIKIYDTLIKTDTIKIKSPTKDTVYVPKYINTIQKDTIKITKIVSDTITKNDTINIITSVVDTLIKHDTIKIHDTVHITKIDTVVDTLQLCNVVNRKYTEEIYPKHMLTNSFDEEGLSAWISKDGQIYKNVNDNRERSDKDFLNYVSVRIKTNFVGKYKVYVYDNSSVFVNDIEVKVSDEYKYSDYTLMITFNGKSKFGKIVSDGVYLLRVISQQENSFGNNVYKIGVKLN